MKKKIILILTSLFFVLLAHLLYERLSVIDMDEIRRGFRDIRAVMVLLSIFVVSINYTILSTYDYLSFRHLNLSFMKYPRVWLSAFICYALTLNIGALVGGLAFRYRVYSRWGVPNKKIPLVISFSVFSNWSGFALLVGIACFTQNQFIQRSIFLMPWLTDVIGGVALGLVLTYLILCFTGHEIHVKGHRFRFPHLPMAFIQLTLSCIQWLLLAFIIFLFLFELDVHMNYGQVLVCILLSSIAGAITHIPAGAGVIETIFLRFGPDGEASRILVALICFRTVYYILPLTIALPSYFLLEIYQKKRIFWEENKQGGSYVR